MTEEQRRRRHLRRLSEIAAEPNRVLKIVHLKKEADGRDGWQLRRWKSVEELVAEFLRTPSPTNFEIARLEMMLYQLESLRLTAGGPTY